MTYWRRFLDNKEVEEVDEKRVRQILSNHYVDGNSSLILLNEGVPIKTSFAWYSLTKEYIEIPPRT